uniref:Heart development protein with EGF-like domains 1 n=1 Tax=Oryzias latipes TaxID=8090 RepID=A0A3P9H6E5_ORYLA
MLLEDGFGTCAARLGVGSPGGCMCESGGEELSLHGPESELRARLTHLPFPAVCAVGHRGLFPCICSLYGGALEAAAGSSHGAPGRLPSTSSTLFHGNNSGVCEVMETWFLNHLFCVSLWVLLLELPGPLGAGTPSYNSTNPATGGSYQSRNTDGLSDGDSGVTSASFSSESLSPSQRILLLSHSAEPAAATAAHVGSEQTKAFTETSNVSPEVANLSTEPLTSSFTTDAVSSSFSSTHWKELTHTSRISGLPHSVSWEPSWPWAFPAEDGLPQDSPGTSSQQGTSTALMSHSTFLTDSTTISRAGERTLLSVTSSNSNSTSSTLAEDSNSHQPPSTWGLHPRSAEPDSTQSGSSARTNGGETTERRVTETFTDSGMAARARGAPSFSGQTNTTQQELFPASQEISGSTSSLDTEQSDLSVSSTPPVTSPLGGLPNITGTNQGSGSSVTGTNQGSGSSVTGTDHGSGSSVTGTNQGSGSSVTGTNQGSGSSVTGTNQASGSSVTGTNQGSGSSVTGTNQGSGSSVTGTNQGSGSSVTGTNQGSGSSVTGTDHGSGSSVTGTNQGSGSSVTGTNQGSGSSVTGTDHGSGSSVTGTNQGSGSSVTGTNQGSGSSVTGTNQASGSSVTGTNQGSGSSVTGTNQGSGSSVTGTNQGSGSSVTGTNQGSGSSVTGTNQGSGSSVQPSTQSSTEAHSSSTQNQGRSEVSFLQTSEGMGLPAAPSTVRTVVTEAENPLTDAPLLYTADFLTTTPVTVTKSQITEGDTSTVTEVTSTRLASTSSSPPSTSSGVGVSPSTFSSQSPIKTTLPQTAPSPTSYTLTPQTSVTHPGHHVSRGQTQRPATGMTLPTKAPTVTAETSRGTLRSSTAHTRLISTASTRSTPTESTGHLHTTQKQTDRGAKKAPGTTPPVDIQPTKGSLRDPCASNPCLNGGMCKSSQRHQFTCRCQQGWKGRSCNQDVDECKQQQPCPADSTCINTLGSFSCECPLGFDLDDGRSCTKAKTFLGTFSFDRYDPSIRSIAVHDLQREIIQLLNVSLSVLRGYSRSTLSKREQGGMQILAVNMFSLSTDVTTVEVFNSIQMSLNNCSSSLTHCRMLLQHRLSYRTESLCQAQRTRCDPERTVCSDSSGTASCQCLQGYYKHNSDDLSCLECSDGYRLENGTCVPCMFGFGGFNCGNFYKLIAVVVSPAGGALLLILVIALIVTCCKRDKNDINKIIFRSGDMQMSPYADFQKNSRISMEWGRETIEMQENGSTKNLLQMTDIYYSPALRNSDLERNGLYPFTGLPGSRHSCIYPAQWNPSFTSDDSRRRDYF